MRAFQTRGCLSAVIRTVLVAECLLMGVRGDGADSEDKLEAKYALIGAGIGLFLAAGFILIKVYIIRKHVYENSTGDCTRRPREPHLLTLSHLSQSENPVAVEFPDVQC